MQRLVYTADIDDEVFELEGLLKTLDEVIEASTDCNVIKSRIESPDEVCENGEWEE